MNDFIELVRKMREWQDKFFSSKGKDRNALEMAKMYEKEVDKQLLNI